jgi:cytochrome c
MTKSIFDRLALIGLSCAALSACGSESAADPVEQIVISKPGEEKAFASAASSDGNSQSDIIAAGQAAFAICTGCHVAEKGAASTAGPNLYGVIGRKSGSVQDFAYSEALTGANLLWDDAQLNAYIANPSGAIPGTSMVAGAVEDADARAAIIAYLASLQQQ